jgi:Mrp family chromosome partitioning ATPase
VNDVERVLGIPALGWMVEDADGPTAMFGEDLMRRMAGSLIREQVENGTHVFAFSAVKPGAGSSEMVLALARTLTALGYPALAMEANAFKPDPRMRVGAADMPGLAQCLTGEASLAECIIPAAGDLPARIWVGDTGDRRHLDRLDRVSEVAAGCKADFRFVLVDIPPLLLSADAEILASNLQHLVMVVEAGGITGGELRRAGRQLERVAPAAVGAVVNRVQAFSGGGYLREMLLEYLTGRKTAEYFTEPGWQIALRAALTTLPAWLFRTPDFLARLRHPR